MYLRLLNQKFVLNQNHWPLLKNWNDCDNLTMFFHYNFILNDLPVSAIYVKLWSWHGIWYTPTDGSVCFLPGDGLRFRPKYRNPSQLTSIPTLSICKRIEKTNLKVNSENSRICRENRKQECIKFLYVNVFLSVTISII